MVLHARARCIATQPIGAAETARCAFTWARIAGAAAGDRSRIDCIAFGIIDRGADQGIDVAALEPHLHADRAISAQGKPAVERLIW